MKGMVSTMERRDIESGRRRLLDRAIKLRCQIEQIFLDCAYWNDNVRKDEEGRIDCDPDGQLRRIADGLDTMLAHEAQG